MTLPSKLLVQIGFVLSAIALTVDAQPTFVKQIPEASKNFISAGDLVYFTSNDSLFRTDGTGAGTIFLKSGFDFFGNFLKYKGLLIFTIIKSFFHGLQG